MNSQLMKQPTHLVQTVPPTVYCVNVSGMSLIEIQIASINQPPKFNPIKNTKFQETLYSFVGSQFLTQITLKEVQAIYSNNYNSNNNNYNSRNKKFLLLNSNSNLLLLNNNN
jgi:hypothetical protein